MATTFASFRFLTVAARHYIFHTNVSGKLLYLTSLLRELLLRVVQNRENISAKRGLYLEYAEIDLYVYTCTYVYTISCNIHDIIVYSVCIYILKRVLWPLFRTDFIHTFTLRERMEGAFALGVANSTGTFRHRVFTFIERFIDV